MYKVIEFGTGEVDVVPSSWIKDNKVPWAKTAKAFALKNFNPKSSWQLYKCKTRYNDRVFDTYQEASEKCNLLLYETDSSDCNNADLQKRKKKLNQNSDFEYFEDDNLDDLPDSPFTSSEGGADKTVIPSEEEIRGTSVSSVPKVIADANGTFNVSDIVLEPFCKCSEIKTLLNLEVGNLKVEIENLKKAVTENSSLIEKFIIQSKREWEAIKFAIGNNDNTERRNSFVNNELEQLFQELIPLSSVDDIKVLNELLMENDKRAYFITRAKRIGGKDAKATIANIIKNYFTVETQHKCNWSGANAKYCLKDTKFVEVIVQIVLEIEQITKTEIEKHIKYVFQHTYDRVKAEAKQHK